MVANRVNPEVTFFLTLMHGGLVGNKNIINGHAIYNALLCAIPDMRPDEIDKVSFGISQNDPVTFPGFNKYITNTDEESKIVDENKKKKVPDETILDNFSKVDTKTGMSRGYEVFTVLRSTENILTNPLFDYSPIPFEIIKTARGTSQIIHKIDYFVFYIVWKNAKPRLEFKNKEIVIGAGRNNGFGFSNIERVFNTTMSNIVAAVPEADKYTAINGITGIYNHARYGFGEYVLDTMNTGARIIKLTTPLCMNSTFPNVTQYGTLPTFVKSVPYTKSGYSLWDKGLEQSLQVIRPGKAFEIQEAE